MSQRRPVVHKRSTIPPAPPLCSSFFPVVGARWPRTMAALRLCCVALAAALLALTCPQLAEGRLIARLGLNTTRLDSAGDWVRVSWRLREIGGNKSVPAGDDTDFLALLPVDAKISDTSPTKVRPEAQRASRK